LGVSKPMAAVELRGSGSTNPSEAAYFALWAGGVNSIDTQAVNCIVEIVYRAV